MSCQCLWTVVSLDQLDSGVYSGRNKLGYIEKHSDYCSRTLSMVSFKYVYSTNAYDMTTKIQAEFFNKNLVNKRSKYLLRY